MALANAVFPIKNRFYFISFIVVVAVAKFIHIALLIDAAGVEVDAGYFLSMSRDLYLHGKLPMIDIYSAYGFIGYYIYGIPYVLIDNPKIEIFYYMNVIFILLSSVFFYLSLRTLGYYRRLFFTLIYFLSITSYITSIKMENIIVLFSSVLIWLVTYTFNNNQRNRRTIRNFIISLVLFLALFTKQYALILLPIIASMFFLQSNDYKFRNISEVSIFYFLIIILYVLYYSIWHDFKFLTDQFLGKPYCRGESYGVRQLSNLGFGLLEIGKIAPFYFLIIIYNVKNIKRVLTLTLILGLVIMPTYFVEFGHYLLIGLPFIIYLGLVNFILPKRLILVYGILMTPFITMARGMISTIKYYDDKINQVKFEEAYYDCMKDIVVKDRPMYINGPKELYFVLEGRSFYDLKVGYSFLYNLECIELVKTDGTIVITKEKMVSSGFKLLGECGNSFIYIYSSGK